jgi:hypothetical protein
MPYFKDGNSKMLKLTLTAAALLLAASIPATAETKNWNVTEISSAGVAAAQGTWTLVIDGGKVTGKASLQLQNGNPVGYSINGTFADATYTLTLTDRTDEKKGCVWTGKSGSQTDAKILQGEVHCDGNVAFRVKAGS